MDTHDERGAQRLSREQISAWEDLGFGMFIHFGMSTYDGKELSSGATSPEAYCPDRLDVDGWIRAAARAGMRYAVLTTKHVAGFCLWESRHTDYHVGASGNRTDVVALFMEACAKHGVLPGFYYCSWDNHHLFGSKTPSTTAWQDAFTTAEYRDFQTAQLLELNERYPGIREWWIDIPRVLPRDYRNGLYAALATATPEAVIVMNNGISDGTSLSVASSWPTDVVTIERNVPPSRAGHEPWREIEGDRYYVAGEVCECIGSEWFHVPGDTPRADEELFGIYLTTRARGANLLLDVGPDRHGELPAEAVGALDRLAANIARLG